MGILPPFLSPPQALARWRPHRARTPPSVLCRRPHACVRGAMNTDGSPAGMIGAVGAPFLGALLPLFDGDQRPAAVDAGASRGRGCATTGAAGRRGSRPRAHSAAAGAVWRRRACPLANTSLTRAPLAAAASGCRRPQRLGAQASMALKEGCHAAYTVPAARACAAQAQPDRLAFQLWQQRQEDRRKQQQQQQQHHHHQYHHKQSVIMDPPMVDAVAIRWAPAIAAATASRMARACKTATATAILPSWARC